VTTTPNSGHKNKHSWQTTRPASVHARGTATMAYPLRW